jgi:signal transduction histidine kinase
LKTARDRAADLLENHPLKIAIATDTPPLVQIDGELLRTALGNLLANAARHTPPGTAIELHAALAGLPGEVIRNEPGIGYRLRESP